MSTQTTPPYSGDWFRPNEELYKWGFCESWGDEYVPYLIATQYIRNGTFRWRFTICTIQIDDEDGEPQFIPENGGSEMQVPDAHWAMQLEGWK